MKILDFFLKRSHFDAFLRPSTLKTEFFFKKKLRVCYADIEESFDTIFNMGYGSGNRPWAKGVTKTIKVNSLPFLKIHQELPRAT